MSRRLKILLLTLLLLALACGGAGWLIVRDSFDSRVGLLTLGMPRAEVEELLRPYVVPPEKRDNSPKMMQMDTPIGDAEDFFQVVREVAEWQDWRCGGQYVNVGFDKNGRVRCVQTTPKKGQWASVREWVRAHLGF